MLVKGFGLIALLLILTACGGNTLEIEQPNDGDDGFNGPGAYILYVDDADYEAKVYYPDNTLSGAEYTPVYTPVYEPAPAPTPVPTPRPAYPPVLLPLNHECDEGRESVICYTCAAILIGMMEAVVNWDDGEIWGVNLNERGFMFACALTRQVAASRQNQQGTLVRQPEGVYTGILPTGIPVGNTFAQVFGERWGMVSWEFKEDNRNDTEKLVATMAYELFRTWQPTLFIGNRSVVESPNMNTVESRTRKMLEIEALVYALHNQGERRMQGVYAALSARYARQQTPQLARSEFDVETAFGTPNYTVARHMRHTLSEQVDWVMDEFDRNIRNLSMLRAGCTTGALYALLLTELGVDWKTDLRWNTDLASRVRNELGLDTFTPYYLLDLTPFGYNAIRADATAWVANHERLVREAHRLFSLPSLRFPREGEFTAIRGQWEVLYIPGLIGEVERTWVRDGIFKSVLGERTGYGVYGDMTFSSSFGQLALTRGTLLSSRMWSYREVPAYGMVITENTATGPGWALTLNPWYQIHEGDGYYIILHNRDVDDWIAHNRAVEQWILQNLRDSLEDDSAYFDFEVDAEMYELLAEDL